VGVAGTVTTLGALDLDLPEFAAERLNGHFLPTTRVRHLAAWLRQLDYDAIRALPQVNAQRADLITAGALILETALDQWGLPGIHVSTRGLRYGLLRRDLGLLPPPPPPAAAATVPTR
jgi:exopolyphosphatase/guanosine-5'-triphosphate,3'-diphosphate pyrophosphatase